MSTRIWKPIEEAPIDAPIISYCRKHGVLDGTKQWLMRPLHGRGNWTPSHYIPYPTSTVVDGDAATLALPTDNTALREMITKAGEVTKERCAVKVKQLYGNRASSYVDSEINALPDVTLEDLK